MIRFHQATASYGSSDYRLTEQLFPQTLQDPVGEMSLIEVAIRRHHPGLKFELEHHITPAFPEFNVPSFHIYMCNGIRVAYIVE